MMLRMNWQKHAPKKNAIKENFLPQNELCAQNFEHQKSIYYKF